MRSAARGAHESLFSAYPCRSTTTGPLPPQRTKMSAPCGLCIVFAGKLDGKEGGVWLDTVATAKRDTARKRRIIDTSVLRNNCATERTDSPLRQFRRQEVTRPPPAVASGWPGHFVWLSLGKWEKVFTAATPSLWSLHLSRTSVGRR